MSLKRFNDEERQALMKTALDLKETEGLSNRKIAGQLGVSPTTINRLLRPQELAKPTPRSNAETIVRGCTKFKPRAWRSFAGLILCGRLPTFRKKKSSHEVYTQGLPSTRNPVSAGRAARRIISGRRHGQVCVCDVSNKNYAALTGD